MGIALSLTKQYVGLPVFHVYVKRRREPDTAYQLVAVCISKSDADQIAMGRRMSARVVRITKEDPEPHRG